MVEFGIKLGLSLLFPPKSRIAGEITLTTEERNAMDLSTPDVVRDELIKTNPTFRDLVHQHQSFEARLTELAHLTYPNDDEQVEESTLKKKKLMVKDAIFEMMHDFEISH